MKIPHLVTRHSTDGEKPANPREAIDALLREIMERQQKQRWTSTLRNIVDRVKPQKVLDEERAERARKAQYDQEAQRAKDRAAWKLEDEGGNAAKQTCPVQCSYYEEELTASDSNLMRKLGTSPNTYEKLPAYLLDKLKEAGVGDETACIRTWRRLSQRKKTQAQDNGEGSSRGTAMRMNGDTNSRCNETGEGNGGDAVAEKKERTSDQKYPVLLILAHPAAKYMDVVRELASEISNEIRQRGTGAIQRAYQYEDLPLLGVPGPSCTPPPQKVKRMGFINVIDIDNYHHITMTQPSYDTNGKLIKIPAKPLGCSQKDYARRLAVRNHIAADVDGNRLFIITDWLKPNSMANTVQLYREEICNKANRCLLPVYVNCAEGAYRHCFFTYKRIGPKGKDIDNGTGSSDNGEGPSTVPIKPADSGVGVDLGTSVMPLRLGGKGSR